MHCPYSRLGGHSDRETPGIPSRTRKLSLTAPMVLHPPGCGRVGHHRAHTTQLAREPPTTAAPGQLLVWVLMRVLDITLCCRW